MTLIPTVLGVFLLLLSSGAVEARSAFHAQAEDALARSFNDFYKAVAAQPNSTRAQVQALDQQIIQPVASNYDRMIGMGWQQAINRRLDENSRLSESAAPTSNPYLRKILGRLGFGEGDAASDPSDAGANRPAGGAERGADGGAGSRTPRAEDKVIIDGTDVPRLLEYPSAGKKKSAPPQRR